MEVDSTHLLMALASAFLVGFSKTGTPGLGVLLVPLMAAAVGPTQSAGVLLPALILADIFAVARYRAHTQWRIILRLLPWVLAGMLVGSTFLQKLTESEQGGQMGLVLGVMVIVLVGFQAIRDRLGPYFEEKMPHTWWFSMTMGLLAGFATGLAHLAGPVMAVYFLSMNLKKHAFMGSAAVFFMIVNVSKIPLYIPQGNITWPQFVFGLKVAAAVPVSAVLGMIVFKYIPQKLFNRIVLVLAGIAALNLIRSYFAG
ncbi:MAG: sulfite exporter TauE/SafE family protein [Planctomycetota bacterium]|jgi:uncharacterized membrane protein YfcA